MEIELRSRLVELIHEAVSLTGSEPIDGIVIDDELFLPDFLDSIGLTTLMTLAEDEWDFRFEDEEIVPEMFETIRTLATAIQSKRKNLPPA